MVEHKDFHNSIKKKMDEYAHCVYRLTKSFPKDEIFGLTSQLRRAVLSVVLNYIEGYARGQGKANENFLNISFGSLQESKYLLEFCLVENIIDQPDADKVLALADEIGAILWSLIHKSK